MIAESTHVVPTVDMRSEGKHVMKNLLRIMVMFAIVLIGSLGAAVAYLSYPGTPNRSRFMAFDGYIGLPGDRLLNVLDYLTLNGNTLFVTSESSGALYKIALNSSNLPASPVAEMSGNGGVHGVALIPGQNVAFITRGEADTVDIFDPNSLRQLGSIPVADDADAILYAPSARLVYVANGDARLATLIDPEKRVTVGIIHLPGKPEFSALDPQTGLLYQNLEDINSIAGIDLGKRSIAGQCLLLRAKDPPAWRWTPSSGASSRFVPAMQSWWCLTWTRIESSRR
jgi:hypothetical protein